MLTRRGVQRKQILLALAQEKRHVPSPVPHMQ